MITERAVVRCLAAVLLVGTIAGTAVAQSAAEAVTKRQAAMKAIQAQMPTLRAPASSAEQRRAAAKAIHENLLSFSASLPKGSGMEAGLPTKARPEIWTDAAGFKAALDDAVAATGRAATADDAGVAGAAAEAGGTCFGCHSRYRA